MKTKIFILVILFILFSLFTGEAYAFEKSSGSSAMLAKAGEINSEDNRVKTLRSFFEYYNSPLSSYAQVFIDRADEYNLDWRLVEAISGVESTFGLEIPYGTYNAWGWGIYGNNVTYFKSWEDGITTISKGLRENYIDRWGATNIYEIGAIYAASPTWAVRV